MTIQIQGDIGNGHFDDDLGPFLCQLWNGEFGNFLRMGMLIGVRIDQRNVLIRTWTILQKKKENGLKKILSKFYSYIKRGGFNFKYYYLDYLDSLKCYGND